MKTYSAHFYIVHKPPFGPVPETSLSIEEKPVTKMSATQKPAIASNESSGNSSNSESDVESISEQENQKKKRISNLTYCNKPEVQISMVKWLLKKTHVQEVVGLNRSIGY